MIYYFLMFFAGAILAKVTFYFQNKQTEKDTIHMLSAQIISALEFIVKTQEIFIEDKADFYNKANSWDDYQKSKYLHLERRYLDEQMTVVTMLLISSFEGRFGKHLLFEDWKDIKRVLKKAEDMIIEENDS